MNITGCFYKKGKLICTLFILASSFLLADTGSGHYEIANEQDIENEHAEQRALNKRIDNEHAEQRAINRNIDEEHARKRALDRQIDEERAAERSADLRAQNRRAEENRIRQKR